MKFNKLLLISLLLLALVSFGAVSAADDVNSTDDLTVQETADITEDLTANIDENSQTNDKMLKEESTPIVITNETFNDYFDDEGKILDSVAEGATLDFQGHITSSENIKAIYINKSVNIISSTKDATITLNTKNAQVGKENITGRFIVDGAAELNINDVTFNRTQVLIYDSGNIVLNKVNFICDNYRIVPRLHDNYDMVPLVNTTNVKKLSFKNGQVFVFEFGSIVFGCYDTKEALFDNNTFRGNSSKADITNYSGTGHSAKYMIYYPEQDGFVTVNNCIFVGNSTPVSIFASNIKFENNYEEHEYHHVANCWICLGSSDRSNIVVRNNKLLGLNLKGNATVYNNVIECNFATDSDILIYNNTLGSNLGHYYVSDVVIASNSIFYNNTVNGAVRINGNNAVLKDSLVNAIIAEKGVRNITVKNNYIYGLTNGTSNRLFGAITVRSTESFIDNNIIIGSITIEKSANCEIRFNTINGSINIESSDCLVDYNVINAFESDYAVYIKSGKDCINNEVSDNEIYSKWYCGDNAVSYYDNYLNYIEYNTPANQIGMSVNNTVDVFDYGANTTISVNVPGVSGNVTIDVNGEKYTVNLVNGAASYVLTKYSPGFNYVTVIYYDVFDDVWAIGHANFTVNKVAYCPVKLVYGEFLESKHSDINFILPEDAEGTVTVSLTNGIWSVDIEQAANGGNNTIFLPGLPEGDYSITATFTSIKYVTNSSAGTISFVHKPVYKLTANDVVMDYKDGSKYKVFVTKDGKAVSGEMIKITFNGKTSNVKTDQNGYATLTLDAAPKTYAIKAVYNGVTKSGKVTIKNILKAKNLSKKKAKTVKFQATLKTSKGKAIAGKKVTFKLKGKTYSAKTNKKGVATISIKNLKAGKYTITSKYGKCTVKNTIKIK